MLKPCFAALVRAPSQALLANSASAATSATVVGFGFCAAAVSKKPSVNEGFGSGPDGIMAKNFGYLNSVFTARPNRMMNTLPFCMITGMAGAAMLVAYGPTTRSTLSTSSSLV